MKWVSWYMLAVFSIFPWCSSHTQAAVSSEGLSILQQYVTDLEKEIQGLRDRVERLEHWKRLQSAPTSSSSAPKPAPPSSASPEKSSQAQELVSEDLPTRDYNAALTLLQNHQMDDAKRAFNSFQQKYPQHPLNAQARYWVGVIYFSQNNFGAARDAFEALMRAHPKGPKKYDTLLKIAHCAKAQNQPGAACFSLNSLFADLEKEAQRSRFDHVEKQARLLSRELSCAPEGKTP